MAELKKLRESLGLSQTDFAIWLDVEQAFIALVEGSHRKLNALMLEKIIEIESQLGNGIDPDFDQLLAAEKNADSKSQKLEIRKWALKADRVLSKLEKMETERQVIKNLLWICRHLDPDPSPEPEDDDTLFWKVQKRKAQQKWKKLNLTKMEALKLEFEYIGKKIELLGGRPIPE